MANTIANKNYYRFLYPSGPVMAKRDGQWISVKGYNRSLQVLIQSWQRTKAKGFEDYKKNGAVCQYIQQYRICG